jgi:hypothetical protein
MKIRKTDRSLALSRYWMSFAQQFACLTMRNALKDKKWQKMDWDRLEWRQNKKEDNKYLLPATSSVLDGIVGLELHLLANGHANVRRAVSHGGVAGNGRSDGTVNAVHRLVGFPGASMLGGRLVGRITIVRIAVVELGLSLLVGRRRAGAVARLALAEA